MSVEKTEVLVVGAGQAGIAMSEHLRAYGIDHLVLERSRIAERWRSCRWDSLVANGPAWHDRFPGMEFPGYGPDDFVTKEDVADYFRREVLPHAPDAWIDPDKTKVGYEIPFNRHFYVFKPPRPLAEIDAELKQTTDRILEMIKGLSA